MFPHQRLSLVGSVLRTDINPKDEPDAIVEQPAIVEEPAMEEEPADRSAAPSRGGIWEDMTLDVSGLFALSHPMI